MSLGNTETTRTGIRNLCSKFGYPSELEEILTSISEILQRTYGRSLKSVIVCGSVATGDFVWRREGADVRLMSDIDAVALVEGATGRRQASEAISGLRSGSASSPLFHVDVSIGSPRSVRRGVATYQTAEIRDAGWLLLGQDLRGLFPSQFQPAAAREAFFFNLWKPLLFSTLKGTQPEVYALTVARQILDVTILAFSQAGVCLPGHRRRVQAFLTLPEEHSLATAGVRKAVNQAMRIRERGAADIDQLEAAQMETLRTSMTFLDSGMPSDWSDPTLPLRIRRLLPSRRLRRLAAEVRNECRAGHFNPLWIRRRKETFAAAVLLFAYQYRAGGGKGPIPGDVLKWMEQHCGTRILAPQSEEFLHLLRRVYWAGQLRLRPSAAMDRNWVEPLIGLANV